mmetsp:Transcript_24318/g.51745  ORF Transcript_24318/g.51745 Transcript_24318/m.51745 type:complete len:306 (+) Transcript_24318:1123-2040(+)
MPKHTRHESNGGQPRWRFLPPSPLLALGVVSFRGRPVLVSFPFETNNAPESGGEALVGDGGRQGEQRRRGLPVGPVARGNGPVLVLVIPLQVLPLGVPDARPGRVQQNLRREERRDRRHQDRSRRGTGLQHRVAGRKDPRRDLGGVVRVPRVLPGALRAKATGAPGGDPPCLDDVAVDFDEDRERHPGERRHRGRVAFAVVFALAGGGAARAGSRNHQQGEGHAVHPHALDRPVHKQPGRDVPDPVEPRIPLAVVRPPGQKDQQPPAADPKQHRKDRLPVGCVRRCCTIAVVAGTGGVRMRRNPR